MNNDDHQSLVIAHERRIEALLNADTEALAEVVSEDLTFVSAAGAVMTRPEVVASFQAGTMRIERMDCSDISTRIYGDTGVLLYRADGRSVVGGEVHEGITRSTTVYVREGGNWKMVAQHQSRIED